MGENIKDAFDIKCYFTSSYMKQLFYVIHIQYPVAKPQHQKDEKSLKKDLEKYCSKKISGWAGALYPFFVIMRPKVCASIWPRQLIPCGRLSAVINCLVTIGTQVRYFW